METQHWQSPARSEYQWMAEKKENLIWDEYQIRPGIKLAVQNVPPLGTPLCFDYETSNPPIQFLYCLSGSTRIRIVHNDGTKVSGRIASKQYSISYVPDTRGTCVTEAGCPLRSIALLIAPNTLHQLTRQTEASSAEQVRNLVAEMTKAFFYREFTLPLPLEITVRQILDCPMLNRGLKKVFLEYKAMELFYNQLSLLDLSGEECKKIAAFELEAVQRVHDLLMRDLASPPSLLCLAKKVGLTHTRLNKLFRLVHHDTVFGVLRTRRLECAKKMLEDTRKSVSEVAYECGFATPSHLSRAFLDQYGIQPKRYQTELNSAETAV
ncbi:AraC family transcriptional regulator [Desulfobulbus sp.]|uniref:helix-turn-helix domain-containing protein n=1 Tax=Desulfobulbus sp. TaxID=895 RepID=UPI00286F54EF|nr:AraC family transcriptional regulator [Desulfobulbus sp.]